MRRSLIPVFALGVLFLAAPAAAHDFTDRCDSCHLTMPQPGIKGFFVRDIDDLCRECHRVDPDGSHPVGVFASLAVPAGFPLDWEGRITCSTCHDPHADRRVNPDLLRSGAVQEDFCRQCHGESFGDRGRHPAVGAYAHNKSWTQPDGDSFPGNIDDLSHLCLTCHDGASMGQAARFELAGQRAFFRHGANRSHPIGIDYAREAASNLQLRSPDALSPAVSLYEGKVGCASCHSLYSAEPAFLVFSNRGSTLCLECHLK